MTVKNNESTIFNTFLKIGTFSIAVLGLIGGFFITVNTILAQKADKQEVQELKNDQDEKHKIINSKLEAQSKILIKLDTMADLYLKKNKKD